MRHHWHIPAYLFLATALAEVLVVSFGFENVHFWLKPLLMPLLAITAGMYLHSHRISSLMTGLLIASLVAHTLGDIFLLFGASGFFVAGMIAFLIGHFLYIVVLGELLNPYKEHPLPKFRRILANVVVLLVPLAIVLFVRQHLWMSLLIFCYAYVLLVIADLAGRCVTYHIAGAKSALTGIIFFIISDGLLALNQFAGLEFPLRHAVVMGTYLIAEAFLVFGICRALTTSRPIRQSGARALD